MDQATSTQATYLADRHTDLPGYTLITIIFAFWMIIIIQRPGESFIGDGDTYWHLTAGQWIYTNLAVPKADIYSFTAKGVPWVDVEWIAQLVIAGVYRLMHWAGLVLLAACASALSIALLTIYLLRHLRFSVAVGWAAVTVFAISPHFLARPHILSFVVLVCWVTTLLDHYDNRSLEQSIWPAALLMILWANLHGSFVYGLGVYVIFSFFAFCQSLAARELAKCGRLVLVSLVVAGSSLITPYGAKSLLNVLEVSQFHYVLSHIAEWRSPDFQKYWLHSLYLGSLIAALLYFGVQVRGPRLVLFCMNLIFGLTHIRLLIVFFLTAPLLLAKPIAVRSGWLAATSSESDDSPTRPGDPVLKVLSRLPPRVSMIAALALLMIIVAIRWHDLNSGPAGSVAPRAAVDSVQAAGVKGNVFNSYIFGGYLISRGIPVFIDSRQPPYSDDFVHKAFDAVELNDIGAAYKLLDQYRIAWALLAPSEPLAKALKNDTHWRELYSDDSAAVFVRNSE